MNTIPLIKRHPKNVLWDLEKYRVPIPIIPLLNDDHVGFPLFMRCADPVAKNDMVVNNKDLAQQICLWHFYFQGLDGQQLHNQCFAKSVVVKLLLGKCNTGLWL